MTSIRTRAALGSNVEIMLHIFDEDTRMPIILPINPTVVVRNPKGVIVATGGAAIIAPGSYRYNFQSTETMLEGNYKASAVATDGTRFIEKLVKFELTSRYL